MLTDLWSGQQGRQTPSTKAKGSRQERGKKTKKTGEAILLWYLNLLEHVWWFE